MIDIPLIFSGEMVRAYLAGRKTQTRRVIEPQPPESFYPIKLPTGLWAFERSARKHLHVERAGKPFKCPYGQAGDRAWFRETWGGVFYDAQDQLVLQWKAVSRDCRTQEKCQGLFYRATDDDLDYTGCWVSPYFMPKWASRISAPIVKVRAERLHRIGELSAKAEGVEPEPVVSVDRGESYLSHCAAYIKLWDKLNAKRGYAWDVNPWVWVIELEPYSESSNGKAKISNIC